MSQDEYIDCFGIKHIKCSFKNTFTHTPSPLDPHRELQALRALREIRAMCIVCERVLPIDRIDLDFHDKLKGNAPLQVLKKQMRLSNDHPKGLCRTCLTALNVKPP